MANNAQKKGHEKNNTNKDVGFFRDTIAFLNKLMEVIRWERYSIPGQTNLIGTFCLFILLVLYILSSGFVSIARIVASIWNGALTKDSGDTFLTLFLVFAGAFAICLFVVWITRKEIKSSGLDDKEDK